MVNKKPGVDFPTEEQLNRKRAVSVSLPESCILLIRQYARDNDCSASAAIRALIKAGYKTFYND